MSKNKNKIVFTKHTPTHLLLQLIVDTISTLEKKAQNSLNAYMVSRTLNQAKKQLIRPLRISVIGHVNSGKTSIANILLGRHSLPMGVVPNTRFPTLIKFSPEPQIIAFFKDGTQRSIDFDDIGYLDDMVQLDLGLPYERLRHVEVLDHLGLSNPQNAIQELNLSRYQVDVALWCTSGTVPWQSTEKDAWFSLPKTIRDKSIIIVTRKDLLDAQSIEKIYYRLAHELAGETAPILFVSAMQALNAQNDPDLDKEWFESGAEELGKQLLGIIETIRENKLQTSKEAVTKIISTHYPSLL